MAFKRAFLAACVLALVAGCGDDEASGDGSGGSGGGGTGATGGVGGGAGGSAGGGTGGSTTCGVKIPDSYPAADWDANTSVEKDIITRFKAFQQPMKDAEASATVMPTASALTALFDAGSPSLRSITTPYYATQVDGLIAEFEKAAGKTWKPSEPPPSSGGIYSKWIFDARGRDLRQAIEKGMFAATTFNHAIALVASSPDAKAIDRLLAMYGAHPSFPHDDKDPNHPDQFTAQYAKRRDDKTNATPGLYRKLKASFIAARTTAAAGADCAADRDAAVKAIKTDWERTLMSTVVFYANDAAKKLTVDPPTDDDVAAGLHSLGEMVAFVHGYRQIDTTQRTLSDKDVDDILALLGAPATGDATSYKFATETATEVGKLPQVSAKLKAIYGFSDAEMEQFKVAY